MKFQKVLLVTGIAVLAVASIAAAAWNTNLTVGSTGADVVALQNALIAGGFSIPSISSGAATPGYFGSQTKAAVQAYQSARGIPNTGFVGPLTRAALNAGPASVGTTCPAGYNCTANNVVTPVCPAGYTCTAIPGTTAPVLGAPVGISTPGVAGTLSASLWTTPSGVTAYKGQAYDIAGFKLQAGSSDMALSSVSIDFDTRLWLYASSITLRDDTGATIGTVSNLNASNFSELTVGSDYRITVPVSNTVVRATQSKYLTVNVNFLAVTDRLSVAALGISQFQVRSVDGTGITDTETVATNSTSGTDTAGNATIRNFAYQSTNIAQLVVTTDPSSPATGVIQVSTAAQTLNVPLAIYDIKSQNQPATLQQLTIGLTIGNNPSNLAVGSILSNLQIVVGGLTYSASSLSSTSASFTNLQIPLPADQYVPIKIMANLAQDTTSSPYDNAYITTTLNTTLGNADGAHAPTNVVAVDSTYNNIVSNSVTLTSNAQAFSASGVNATSLATTPNPIVPISNTNASSTAQFSFVYTLAAGNNPIYVSATSTLAASTTSTGAPGTISVVSFRDNDSTQDSAGQYFYIAPGGSKTFTLTLQSKGAPGAVAGTYSVTKLWYGTGFTTVLTGVSSLSASTIPNTLYANLSY